VVQVDSVEDLTGLRAVGRVVALALAAMRQAVAPGISTLELDALAAAVFTAQGARSAPRLIYDFPAATCVSVNEEAVHGIPSARRLEQGDLVKLDVTAELDGYFADAAVTVLAGQGSSPAKRLLKAAEQSLGQGLRSARAGSRLAALGAAVEQEAERHGCSVLRDLCGHGIGRSIHEEPQVPNYPRWSDETLLVEGTVLTVEPIISLSSRRVVPADDGWTVLTADGSLSAHFEHTVVIQKGAPLILTIEAAESGGLPDPLR
jgi:methionyl aminopeptidase